MIRKTSYAGSFYDCEPAILRRQFDHWFSQATVPDIHGKVKGIICPHAGYMYSGFCTAHAYKAIKGKGFKTAIIVHPSHRGNHFQYSVSPFTEYQTPLGNLLLRQDWATKLQESADMIDIHYHQSEHSMEVQLPFLAYLEPAIQVLPVMIGQQNEKVSLALAQAIYDLIQSEPDETILIVSTDLSHYHSGEVAESKDRKLIDFLINGKAAALYQNICSDGIEACGFGGVLMLMFVSEMMGKSNFTELLYTHSGHTTGDFSQVVGYLSAALIQERR